MPPGKILVTGAAGFIGYHVSEALLAQGEQVLGVDNLNPYYDIRLKHARRDRLLARENFIFAELDVSDRDALPTFLSHHPGVDRIVHLAAQAGVRHSMIDPHAYVTANVMGHLVVLEAARHLPNLRHLVYASSSSVYGANTQLPFSEDQAVDTPLSLYAATKRADELMSHAYAHLYGIPQTGLRFFTVYGPWGRPDMAYFTFAAAIMAGAPVTVYDGGRLKRDFTYIDDIVAGVIGCLSHPPASSAPRILNIGNHKSESVSTLIALLEESLGRRAIIVPAARPLADVSETFAEISAIRSITGFASSTPLSTGIHQFASWYKEWIKSL